MSQTPPLDFEPWYRAQHPQIAAALIVVSGEHDLAYEAVDEAFVRAYARWTRVGRMDRPGGWVYRVALNDLRRRCRRRAIERRLLRRHGRPADDVAPSLPRPDVWAAVRRLPDRQRQAVALRYLLDLPERDIARSMGISRGAVSASLVAARQTLGRLLNESATDAPPDAAGHGQQRLRHARPHNRTATGAVHG